MTYGVRLRLAYDGSDFSGWQAQAGQRTVAQSIADAVRRITGEEVEIRGASRTDAGVHAEGQVAAFATARELPSRNWVLALNRYLPADVSVWQAEPCAADYQPRFDAHGKTYRYLFHLRASRDALLRNRVWHLGRHVPHARADNDLSAAYALLDLEAMRVAAQALQGTHDFRAFRAISDTRKDTVRTLSRVELLENFGNMPYLLALEVTGTAFMKNMVRIIAGTLIDVGRGRHGMPTIAELLGPGAQRQQAGVTAPPQGLSLLQVRLGRQSHEPATH